jgi:phage replication-related protein YjqB (UPF0714/DUF867 family)
VHHEVEAVEHERVDGRGREGAQPRRTCGTGVVTIGADMSRASILVRSSRADQGDLRRHREHASAMPDLLQTIGLEVGRQAIVRRDAETFALYTLTDAGSEPSVDTVRMGAGGRGRLDCADEQEFEGDLDSVAIDPAATPEEAHEGRKLLELLDDDDQQQGLIILAPHGGDIEPFTDDQAEHVRDLLADLGASCWRCKGWRPGGGALARWHITSTDISTASFPQLGTVAARGFDHAVSFHGFIEDGRPDILIGGRAADSLKRVMQAVIAFAVAGTGLSVEIADVEDPLGGAEEGNIVNRLTTDGHGGIQIEQQPHARSGTIPGSSLPTWQAIAAAVADVYRVILTPSPTVR